MPEANELPAGTQADEEAGMAAGFAEATGQPTPELKTEPAAEPAQPEPKPVAQPAPKPAPKPAAAPAVTAADLKAVRDEIAGFKTGLKDTIHGFLGNWLEKNKAVSPQAPAAKPAGKLTVEKLTKMSESFPDIAEALIADLKDIAVDAQGLPAAEIQKLLDERVSQAMTQANAERDTAIDQAVQKHIPKRDAQKAEAYLSRVDPKWKEDINAPEFSAWLATLDEYERDEVGSSDNPKEVRQSLTDFRKWRDAQKKPVKTTSKQRLEAAVTPESAGSGGSTSEPSEEEAMAIGFKSVRQAA